MTQIFTFDAEGRVTRKDSDLAQVPALLAGGAPLVWIDLEKPSLPEARELLDGIFHFHPLAIEDCLEPGSSPKVEEYIPASEDRFAPHLFIVIHAVDYSRSDGKFSTSELNFFVGKYFLVTCHDVPLRTVSQVRERLEIAHASQGADRLLHLLAHTLVENYKPALDELSQEISALEEQALQDSASRQTMNQLLGLKKEVGNLTRIIEPQGEVLKRLASGDFKLIRARLLPYFRDVSHDLGRIAQQARGYADSLTGIMQISLSLSSNQTGDVVKILTLITVLTTPLMMIGTWYGMNFKDMPELQWPHGYVIAASAMLASTGATYWYFRKKKWF